MIPQILLPLLFVAVIFHFAQSSSLLRSSSASAAGDADELARARTAMGGQLSAFEQVLSRKPRATLDNATILRLWKANVSHEVILQMIRTSNGDYDVSANAVIALRQEKVDEGIILAMIDVNSRPH